MRLVSLVNPKFVYSINEGIPLIHRHIIRLLNFEIALANRYGSETISRISFAKQMVLNYN